MPKRQQKTKHAEPAAGSPSTSFPDEDQEVVLNTQGSEDSDDSEADEERREIHNS